MPKSYGGLYPQIYAFENLWLAYRNARKGKRQVKDTALFELRAEENLFALQEVLQEERFEFSGYRTFLITDPKERLICAAPFRDRVVHHALCNIITPLLDRCMIRDTYACRVGKGTHRAINKAYEYVNKEAWVLKMDLQKYFFTIDHALLLAQLRRKIRDKAVLSLIQNLLATYHSDDRYYFPSPNDDLFSIQRPRGLPIGNLTSQWFANYFLNGLDHKMTQHPKVKGYVRYMDDLAIFASEKQDLVAIKETVLDALAALRLHAHPQKTQIFPAKNGFPFLGFVLKPHHKRIKRENLKRFKARLARQQKALAQESITFDHITQSLQAWMGFIGKGRYIGLIDEILSHYPLKHQANTKTLCVSYDGF